MAELIAGRYQVGASLGTGGMGEVFLATDTLQGRQVAIKRIRRPSGSDSTDPAGMQRLRREAQAAALVHHPNVVTIHDLVADGENLYVVMEYVKGQTLAALARARSGVDLSTLGRIGAQIAGALEAAHRVGVIHRDVKPANILVDAEGTAKLADFGIARSVGDDTLTGTGLLIGSLLFMAPEVAGGGPATAASDVYSLGATLFAACEGHAPFAQSAAPPALLLARLLREPAPPASKAGPLAGLIGRMLATDPAQRPTAAETKHTLDRLTLELSSGTSTWPDSRPETDTSAPLPSGWAAVSNGWATPPAATVLAETPAAVHAPATPRRADTVAAPAAPVLDADTPNGGSSIAAAPTAGDAPAELQPTVIAGTPKPPNVQTPSTTGMRVAGQPKPRRRGLVGGILAITAVLAVVAGMFVYQTITLTGTTPAASLPSTGSPTGSMTAPTSPAAFAGASAGPTSATSGPSPSPTSPSPTSTTTSRMTSPTSTRAATTSTLTTTTTTRTATTTTRTTTTTTIKPTTITRITKPPTTTTITTTTATTTARPTTITTTARPPTATTTTRPATRVVAALHP